MRVSPKICLTKLHNMLVRKQVGKKKSKGNRWKEREGHSSEVRRTTIFTSQLSTLKRKNGTIMSITKQRDNLIALRKQHMQTIGTMWGKLERPKNGLWSPKSFSPPSSHLHHNYEHQRDVLLIAHNLHIGQMLGPKLFQSLLDEVSKEGYENLLVETIVMGELVVLDPLKCLDYCVWWRDPIYSWWIKKIGKLQGHDFVMYVWTPVTLIPFIMSIMKLKSLTSSQWLIIKKKSGVNFWDNCIVFHCHQKYA